MLALIDGDLIAYPVAATCEREEYDWVGHSRCNILINEILMATGTKDFKIFLTESNNNFRKKINPAYKQNREGMHRPRWLESCQNYLVKDLGAELVSGFEADDALGWHQKGDTILCSFDKDLDMIPGLHYNWKKRYSYDVSEQEGLAFFYRQMLIGDATDNIFGVKGIGAVKAPKLIRGDEDEWEMFSIVSDLYDDPDEPGEAYERFWVNADCLWIQRRKGECYSDRFKKVQV